MTEEQDQSQDLEHPKSCFVIGPIGDRLAPTGDDARRRFEEAEELWEYVIEPACAANGLEPVRADKISHPGEIPEQIFELLRDADVVIADLTGGNANVMYELGLRHTRDKITVQIGENERLPFDINTIRTFRFRRTSVGLSEVRDQLTETLKAALDGNASPVTATRVWSEGAADPSTSFESAQARARELAQSEPADAEDDEDEPGFVDILADGEEAIGEMGTVLGRLSGATVDMGSIATTMTERLEASDTAQGGFAGRLTLAKQFADEMAPPTGVLEEAAADYVEVLSRMDPAVTRIIAAAEEDPEERTELEEYLVSVVALATVTAESMEQAAVLAQVYGGMTSLSRVIKPVARRVERALRRVISASEVMEQWADRIRELPDWDENKAIEMAASWQSEDDSDSDGAGSPAPDLT